MLFVRLLKNDLFTFSMRWSTAVVQRPKVGYADLAAYVNTLFLAVHLLCSRRRSRLHYGLHCNLVMKSPTLIGRSTIACTTREPLMRYTDHSHTMPR